MSNNYPSFDSRTPEAADNINTAQTDAVTHLAVQGSSAQQYAVVQSRVGPVHPYICVSVPCMIVRFATQGCCSHKPTSAALCRHATCTSAVACAVRACHTAITAARHASRAPAHAFQPHATHHQGPQSVSVRNHTIRRTYTQIRNAGSFVAYVQHAQSVHTKAATTACRCCCCRRPLTRRCCQAAWGSGSAPVRRRGARCPAARQWVLLGTPG